MFTINVQNNSNIKKYVLTYAIMILCFAVIGFLVPDVSDIREDVGDYTREAVRDEITAYVTAEVLYEDPYATPEDIAYYVAEAIEEEVNAAVYSAIGAEFGILVMIPAIFLLAFIFITKRIIEGLTLAIVLGLVMAYKGEFFEVFNETVLEVLMSEDMSWLIIVCGLMGGVVAVIEKSGGAFAFGDVAVRIAKSARPTLFATMFCSVLLSIDDYLNALTCGAAMTPVNDKHNTPREMTAYVVDSTSVPTCVLNPISTWALFIGGLMVAAGLGDHGDQVLTYMQAIPYLFYAMSTLLVVILVSAGIIPIFGPMKGAFKRVREGGPLAPAGSERIDIRSGQAGFEIPENPKLMNFFAPIIILVGATILFEFDMQMGVITAVGFNFLFFVFQGMEPMDYVDEVLRGLKNMLMPIFMVVLAFSFAEMSEQTGFIYWVVEVATANVTPAMLPVTIFLVFAFTEFIMGISWGMYAIAIPIAVPVAYSLGVDPFIAVGAVISAGAWGAHSCFYSDSTILVSASTGTENFRHAITQIPFGLIGAIIAVIGYIVLGVAIYG